MTPISLILSAAVLISLSAPLWATSYSVTQVISQTQGTTVLIPGSGSKANTTTWMPGIVGRFIVTDKQGNRLGLQVEATHPTGTLIAGQDSLMVARTENSQGLTDTGTISVYISPGNATVTPGNWSLDLRFSFYNITFEDPTPVDLLLTSLDIDAGQRYYTDQADFSSNALYPQSAVTPTGGFPGFSGFTAGGSASFNDPEHAVSSAGYFQSSFDVKVTHNNIALFMFEFRDPSEIVPEPSAALLSALGVSFLLRRRR